jgi:hypothetical protein
MGRQIGSLLVKADPVMYSTAATGEVRRIVSQQSISNLT